MADAPTMQPSVFLRKFKVRKIGKRGTMVTIPTSWLESQGAEVGAEVRAYQDLEGNLILKVQREDQA